MKPPPSRGQALDQDQYDPPARLGAKEPAARLVDKVPQGKWKTAAFPRRLAKRPHRRALPVRRAHAALHADLLGHDAQNRVAGKLRLRDVGIGAPLRQELVVPSTLDNAA